MQKIITANSRETSRTINQNQYTLGYDNTNEQAGLIGGKSKIGDPTVTQLHANIEYPNVASALSNIANAMIPVHGIMFTFDNTDPQGTGATERLTISLTNQSIQDNGIITLYGRQIQFEIGEVLSTVTTKIQTILQTLVDDEIGIHQIHRPVGTQDTIDVTYIDRQKHTPVNINDSVLGLVIQGEVIVNNQHGYGTWDKVGETTELVPGQRIGIWRRIA